MKGVFRWAKRAIVFVVTVGLGWVFAVALMVFLNARPNLNIKADAAVVMGAAAWHGKPSPVLRSRLNYAVKLQKQALVERIVVTGGVGTNDWISEGEVAAGYLVKQGIDASAIIVESNSRSTFGNLCFIAKTLHQADIERLAIVSDPPHVYRSMAIARHFGFEAIAAPIDASRFDSFGEKAKLYTREILSSASLPFTLSKNHCPEADA